MEDKYKITFLNDGRHKTIPSQASIDFTLQQIVSYKELLIFASKHALTLFKIGEVIVVSDDKHNDHIHAVKIKE